MVFFIPAQFFFSSIVGATALILFSAAPAHAYVDPGAGNTLFALISGGLGSVAVLWHLLGSSIRRKLLNRNKRESDSEQ